MQHRMQIESLEIENYRLFRKTSFTDLPRNGDYCWPEWFW